MIKCDVKNCNKDAIYIYMIYNDIKIYTCQKHSEVMDIMMYSISSFSYKKIIDG